MQFRHTQIVVSVEHASWRIPSALADLGLPRAWLTSHNGWDPGAAEVGRILARELGAPLHLGRWSRLLVDLNRSAHHRRVIPASSGRYRIAPNQNLTRAERAARLDRYWHPYRLAVEADLDAAMARHGRALHLSVHSFVPELAGEKRTNHVGLLYEPKHETERWLANRIDASLVRQGFVVRRNYPYSGRDDGFCMRMRVERGFTDYVGMEFELNQRWLRQSGGPRRFAKALLQALLEVGDHSAAILG